MAGKLLLKYLFIVYSYLTTYNFKTEFVKYDKKKLYKVFPTINTGH